MAKNRLLTAAGIMAALALVAGCSVHSQQAPSLTGPSGLGTNLTVAVSPDVLARDGASQSVVTVTATGPTGQPISNLSVRLAVLNESGQITGALGTLSAQNAVTNASGQTTAVFTAPAAIPGVAATTTVDIGATPTGTDFGNDTMRVAQLQLVPQGVIGAPLSTLKPDFTVPTPNVGDNAVFTATVQDAKGNDARNQVTQYAWDFGDGGTASTASASHTFNAIGAYAVTLEITDVNGSVAFVTHSVTVAQGQLPVAAFSFSPTAPNLNQLVNFNGSGSTAAPGHTITVFAWNFGDGTLGSDALTSHTYTQAGTYTVTLKVTDDLGRKSTLTSQTVSVGLSAPTATFTTSPAAAVVNQQIGFNASQSTAVSNRTIVSYSWDFGDGATGLGVTTTHAYTTPGTYTVTLTVTDSAGQQGFATQSVTVANDVPTVSFSVSPAAPSATTGTNAPVVFDASASSAVNGRTITSYSWTITFKSNPAASLNSPSGVVTSGSFPAPGTYTVTLTITDSAGKTNTASQTFTVTGT